MFILSTIDDLIFILLNLFVLSDIYMSLIKK